MSSSKSQPERNPSPTFDIAISIDSLVAMTKLPKKKILALVEKHDLLSTGALISFRQCTKKDGIIVKQGVRIPIAEKIFGPDVVKKFLINGEDY